MEIIYHLNEKDILAGTRFLRKVAPAAKRINQTAISIVALAPCINFLLRQKLTLPHFVQMLFEILLIAFAYILFAMILNPVFDIQAASILKKKNNGIFGEHKICLTEETLIESTSVNESQQKWAGIEGIYENEDYILIIAGNQQGHVIPKRAFTDRSKADQFYSQARSYHEKSQMI